MKLVYLSWAYNSTCFDKVLNSSAKTLNRQPWLFTYAQIEFYMQLFFLIENGKPYNKHINEAEKMGNYSACRLSGDIYKKGKYYGSKDLVLANIYLNMGKLESMYPDKLCVKSK